MKKFIATAALCVAATALSPIAPGHAATGAGAESSSATSAAKKCATVVAKAGTKYTTSRGACGTFADKVTYRWSSKKKICVRGWGYKADGSGGLKPYWSKAKCAKKGKVTVTWARVDGTPQVKAKVASGKKSASYRWRQVSTFVS